MIDEMRRTVLELLATNLHEDYAESRPDRQHLPRLATDFASAASLRALVEIHQHLTGIVDPRSYRTRYIGVQTSTGGYGISYYRDPVISKATNRTNKEIMAVLLPTKMVWGGFIESYLSGHDESPITVPTQCNEAERERNRDPDLKLRDGRPVFHVIGAPSDQFLSQLIESFTRSSLFPH